MIPHLKALFAVVAAFFAPVHAILAATICLVVLDTLTGMLAAWKKKQKITSQRFSRVFFKTLVYLLLICLSFAVEHFFAPEYPIKSMITSLIGLGETLSILENINVLSKTPVVDRLIDALKRKDDQT